MSKAKVVITFTAEYPAGPWADTWTLGDMRRQAKREAAEHADRLCHLARGQRIGLTVVNISEPIIDTKE